MKFFKKKDKKKDDGGGAYPGGSYGGSYGGGMLYPAPQPTSRSPRILATVPPPVLSRIFAFVCPHTQDESYESCEQSAAEDTCMLCDLRDLAHAGMVQKSWRAVAIRLL